MCTDVNAWDCTQGLDKHCNCHSARESVLKVDPGRKKSLATPGSQSQTYVKPSEVHPHPKPAFIMHHLQLVKKRVNQSVFKPGSNC